MATCVGGPNFTYVTSHLAWKPLARSTSWLKLLTSKLEFELRRASSNQTITKTITKTTGGSCTWKKINRHVKENASEDITSLELCLPSLLGLLAMSCKVSRISPDILGQTSAVQVILLMSCESQAELFFSVSLSWNKGMKPQKGSNK